MFDMPSAECGKYSTLNL